MNYVYKIQFPNGKLYIGITKNPASRRRSHVFNARRGRMEPVYCAMRKYGIEASTLSIIGRGSRNYVLWLEKQLIKLGNTTAPNGYNLLSGGNESPALLPKAREKIRQSKLLHWADQSYRDGMIGKMKLYRPTDEQRRKNSEAKKRQWQDPAYRARMVQVHTGKKDSAETRARKSITQMGHAPRNHKTPIRNDKGQWIGWVN